MMFFRSPYRVTKGGWGLLVLFLFLAAGCYNASLNILYLLDSLLGAVLLMALVAPGLMVRKIRCERSLPQPAFAGEPFRVSLSVTSARKGRAHLLEAADPLCAGGPDASGRLVIQLGPGERRELSCKATPLPRGVHTASGPAVGSRFPFGMAERWRWDRKADELLVYPLRGQLSRRMSESLLPSGSRIGAPMRMGLPGDEFRTVRQYRSGDNPRHIHWRATARHGELLVREMERERSSSLVVVLDSRLPEGSNKEAAGALELAIGFAAELARAAHIAGNQVTLIGFFPEPRVIRVSGGEKGQQNLRSAQGDSDSIPAALMPLYEALARLSPSPEKDAASLEVSAEEAGLEHALRIMAVTPTNETASGLATLLAGTRAQMFIATSPEFAAAFRPFAAGKEGA
jgi:uncharacterized protein (DUF58 family)